ncbi:unnamed protein product [Candidula unifasciata]|uniref:N-acetyltransferase domain-containing protein n=1 Tax=Candidula unifasciata TaxID=100452 RepID=A0A8S3ZGK7_9EUPU|nr:unnamed protein product [Candidula unifasciata]
MDNKDNLANLEHYCNSMHLPLQATLPDGNPVVIDTMTDSQITDMYEMITSAALSGHGYVTDEYPTEKDFRTEIKDGHNFIVCGKDCGKMIAAFSLINSKFYRGSDLTFADPIIIVKRSERGKGIGEFIFGHVVLFSKLLGYSGIYTDTFSNNIAMTKIIERSPGFQHVGHLPIGGKLSDGSFVSANIYFKDLRDPGETSFWTSGE